MPKKIKDYVIPKPWGYEYLFFESRSIGIWFLHIDSKQKTSLHCHPNKKTGLILLNGKAELSFLNGKRILFPMHKTMLWKGVFHSTRALSSGGIEMLEVESPKNKEDLIRIEDKYGRQDKGYEPPDKWTKRNDSHLWFPNKINGMLEYGRYQFFTAVLSKPLLKQLGKDDIVILLRGNAVVTEQNNPVCKVGDVVMVETLRRLTKQFHINPDNMVMCVKTK